MRDWLVPLAVALIAASATVLAAYVTGLKERRNERARLLQDFEILDKLSEGVARRVLSRSIAERTVRMTVESRLSRDVWHYGVTVAFAAVISALSGVVILAFTHSGSPPSPSVDRPWLTVLAATSGVASVGQFYWIIRRYRLRIEHRLLHKVWDEAMTTDDLSDDYLDMDREECPHRCKRADHESA
ncbi:hypothetical protein [Mycobacteroides abscessus]|uniref:hypothetical protein n=1 Tax=Mycobacteroides abscessus TaxID=36809 RepID=UPI0009A5AC0E|nr:hypothetical protein [Mycobacteroides abscessus]